MSFKTLCHSVYTVFIIIIYGALGELSKYNRVVYGCISRSKSSIVGNDSKYRSKRGGGYRDQRHLQVGADAKAHETKRPKSSTRAMGSLSVRKGYEGPSCRRKLDAALPVLLKAVQLDNAGSLEAVGAYREVVGLFDDAIEILRNKHQDPNAKRVSIEAGLQDMVGPLR
ncbi:hypothetical protein RHS04_02557 [Rhizoctonia solani]|uniref:Uncharacterized protein n=1 Tax=Rhizoctonia solani TaxID=456999 RepID=A0A8H7LJV4_9AGAM|nr:hypothetical protein RHS04_02557 [Rhizoctonia solani]KAF8759003.1 hypothetical protein RHS01_02814 [Rhizoctonia solani]